MDAPSLVWTTGGAVPWFAQEDVTHDGSDAAQGTVQIEYDRSWIETTVTESGQINFFWKCSTLWPDYDRLAFYLDGELLDSIPGDTDWQQASFIVPDGTHTLRWVFEVDSEPTAGHYYAWLDQVQFTPAKVPPVGRVVAWGTDMWGTTNVPAGLSDITAISAGYYHVLALRANRTVVAWGGQNTEYPEIAQVPEDLENVVAVAAGTSFSLALKSDGTVAAWGYSASAGTPTHVPEGLSGVVAVAAGDWHALALHGDGTVTGWGLDGYGETSPPPGLTNVIAIAAGGGHSLALRADRTVVGWGYNSGGAWDVPEGLNDVVAIAATGGRRLAVKVDGTVVQWGANSSGINAPPAGLASIAAVAGGQNHTLGMKRNGLVVAWGDPACASVPAGLGPVIGIAAGNDYSVVWVPEVAPLTLAQALNAPALDWTTGGAVPWWPEYDISHDEFAAAQATVRVWREQSWIATTLTGPAQVGFFWKCSTLWPDYDREAFYIDGTLISSIPGDTDWEQASFLVPPGEHELKWVFEVESEPTGGFYYAWLDEVTIDTGVVITPPSIVRQPVSQTVPVGGDAFFSVSVEGTPPMRYQWRLEGEDLEGETTSQLVLTNVQPFHAGSYSVTVDNGTDVAVSKAAQLTVVPARTAWVWAGQGGGSGVVNGGGSVAVDRDGNLFVTGSFSEEGHFGPFVLSNSWVTRFFLAKYDPAGNVLWVRTTTGAIYSASYGSLVSVDASGNVYVAGTFADAMGDQSRARIAFGAHSITNVGWFEDVFLAKYDPSGEALWARRMGGPRQEFVYDLAVDAAGNAWITGGFGQARYDANGTMLWAQNVSGLTALKLALDPTGNAYLSGRCSGPVTLDGATVGPGLFVVKYSPASDVLWTRTGGPNELGSCQALACDAAGNLFIAGAFQGSTDFTDYSVTASDTNALFLAKFNVFGDALWAREVASSPAGLNAQHLFLDGASQLYFAAGFDGIVSFGDQWLASLGSDGVFLAQFDDTGERHWVTKLPAGAGTGGRAFAADAAGRIFNTGSFAGTVAFGPNQITCPYVNGMYLARLDGNLTVAPALAVRELSALCQPGIALTVRLSITPDEHAIAWAVVEQAPGGWTVSNISDDGVFDAELGVVKFGPFSDSEPRVLSYDSTPPLNARGPQYFFGTVSSDGINTAIGGNVSVEATPLLHPADNTPADSTMTANEVSAYSAAWRQGQSWPLPPNPIPIEFVTRAAVLAENGGCYQVDPAKAPPMCWVPCAPAALPARSFVKSAPAPSEVTRSLPANFFPQEPLPVSITVTPQAGVKACAVEDVLPTGWTVSSVSDGGEFDATQRRLKWGPFLDGTARTLTYSAIPPASASGNCTFAGRASFDGANVPTAGPFLTSSGCRLAGQGQLPDRQFHATLTAPLGGILKLEGSTNLMDWVPVCLLTNTTGAVEFQDAGVQGQQQRFYRAILLQ